MTGERRAKAGRLVRLRIATVGRHTRVQLALH